MSEEQAGALDALIQEKIDSDTEFQSSLEQMEDSEKETAIESKRKQLANATFQELQEKQRKDEELIKNYKIRAEKAEKAEKGKETKPKESQESDLSSKDIYALMSAQVPEEDIDEVVRAAKVLNKTVPEALKDPVVKGILKQNDEYRKTAQAQNTGKSKAGQKAVSVDEIVNKARKGEVPEDPKSAEELFWARRGGRRN